MGRVRGGLCIPRPNPENSNSSPIPSRSLAGKKFELPSRTNEDGFGDGDPRHYVPINKIHIQIYISSTRGDLLSHLSRQSSILQPSLTLHTYTYHQEDFSMQASSSIEKNLYFF